MHKICASCACFARKCVYWPSLLPFGVRWFRRWENSRKKTKKTDKEKYRACNLSFLIIPDHQKQRVLNRERDDVFKIVLVGETGVGKTALMIRFAEDYFQIPSISTIGRSVYFKQKLIRIQLWGTLSLQRLGCYRNPHAYYRNAHVAVIVYDINDRNSFDSVSSYLEMCQTNEISSNFVIVIGNKIDLDDQSPNGKAVRAVSREEGEKFCRQKGLAFMETSAKSGRNAKLTLRKIISMAYEKFSPVPPVNVYPTVQLAPQKGCIEQ